VTALVSARLHRVDVVQVERDRLWPVIADVTRYERLMPHVRSHQPLEGSPDTWHWILEPTGGLGRAIQPVFDIRYELRAPEAIEYAYVESSAAEVGDAHGAFILTALPTATRVTSTLRMELRLAIPRLIAGGAKRLIEQRMDKMAQGFVLNAAREAASAD